GDSDYRDVSVVVQPPGGVAHQTHGSIAPPASHRLSALDRGPQGLPGTARERRVRPADRVEDVRVRAAELGRAEAHVQSPGQLVEEIEAGCRVLDLDGIEVEFRGQPSHSVHGTAAGAPLRAPERMDRDRDAALVVDRMHGRRARHAGPDAALEEQADDVAVAARDLFTDDHFDATATPLPLRRCPPRASPPPPPNWEGRPPPPVPPPPPALPPVLVPG